MSKDVSESSIHTTSNNMDGMSGCNSCQNNIVFNGNKNILNKMFYCRTHTDISFKTEITESFFKKPRRPQDNKS